MNPAWGGEGLSIKGLNDPVILGRSWSEPEVWQSAPPWNWETGVWFPVGSDQRLLKVVPDASLLGNQHEWLDWGKFPVTYRHHVQGVYLYIKLPHDNKKGYGLSSVGEERLVEAPCSHLKRVLCWSYKLISNNSLHLDKPWTSFHFCWN